MVDAQRFLKEFIGEWRHDLTHAGQSLRQAFQNDTPRTAYMLDGKDAFLRDLGGGTAPAPCLLKRRFSDTAPRGPGRGVKTA